MTLHIGLGHLGALKNKKFNQNFIIEGRTGEASELQKTNSNYINGQYELRRRRCHTIGEASELQKNKFKLHQWTKVDFF